MHANSNNFFQAASASGAVIEARISNINLFNSTITTSTTSGLSDANSSFTIATGSLTFPSFTTTAWMTASTNPAVALDYSRTENVFSGSNSEDDDLSEREVAGIVIGAVAGATIIGLLIFVGVCICVKKKWLCFKQAPKVSAENQNNSQSA